MNPNDAIKLSVLAGEIMLSSGAETYRVEDTMIRILKSCGFESVESFVTTTGVFASICDPNLGFITMIKRVKNRTYNFEKIALVNDLSRTFSEEKITAPEAAKKLEEINLTPPYPSIIRFLCGTLACFCFAYILGGSLYDCISSAITAFPLQMLIQYLSKNKVSSVLINIIGGATISFIALCLINIGIGQNLDKIIIGAIMTLVPGVSITNAIRDVLEGDYLSGTTRIMDALLVAISIAVGVGTIIKTWFYIFGGVSI